MEKTLSIICIIILFLPLVQGLDFSVSPSVISLEHLKPGTSLEKTLRIVPDNTDNYSLEIVIDDQLSPYLDIKTVEHANYVDAIVAIHIPPQTPPGKITGKLRCQLKPKQNPGIRAAIELPVSVLLAVSTEDYADHEMKLLRVEDNELVFVIDNLGNTDYSIEHIDIAVYDNNRESIILEESLSTALVTQAFTEQEHRVKLPTLPTGQYWASITVQDDKEDIIFDYYQQEELSTEALHKQEEQTSSQHVFLIISLLALLVLGFFVLIRRGFT